jgi:hypothetical protein
MLVNKLLSDKWASETALHAIAAAQLLCHLGEFDAAEGLLLSTLGGDPETCRDAATIDGKVLDWNTPATLSASMITCLAAAESSSQHAVAVSASLLQLIECADGQRQTCVAALPALILIKMPPFSQSKVRGGSARRAGLGVRALPK